MILAITDINNSSNNSNNYDIVTYLKKVILLITVSLHDL